MSFFKRKPKDEAPKVEAPKPDGLWGQPGQAPPPEQPPAWQSDVRGQLATPTQPPPPPQPAPEPAGPLRKVDGGWQIHVENVDEAKQVIAELKDKKRDLQTLKKEVAAEQAEVRAQHAERRAGRIVMPKGGGTFGRMMRTGIQSSRRSDRMRMQAEVQAYNDKKAQIDYDMRQIDGAIAQMQAYVTENAPAKTPRQAAPKPASASEVTEKLKALVDLKEAGIISEAEYEAKRAELLARL